MLCLSNFCVLLDVLSIVQLCDPMNDNGSSSGIDVVGIQWL